MAISNLKNKLLETVNHETKDIEKRKISVDKFSVADSVLDGSEVKLNKEIVNKARGKAKTYYLSRETLETLNKISDRLLSLRVRANNSDVIAMALNRSNELSDRELKDIAEIYLQSKSAIK